MLFKQHFITHFYMRNPTVTLVKSKTKLLKNVTLLPQKHLFSRIMAPLRILRFSPSPLCQPGKKVIFVISVTRAMRMGIGKKENKFLL